ncbi:MAG: DUF3846 domain-containing protein [Acholeplasmataceae bacterium]|nr:DUF3846 domain-containing protein [Acholeplasmataceae bacterium]
MKCSICNKEITGYPNNAEPISAKPCCEKCNDYVVVPMRLYQLGLHPNEAILITKDYKIQFVKPEHKEFSLEELQSYVEGYIETYPFQNKHYVVLVNEEGLLKNLEFNHLAKQIFGIWAVGNVLICPKALFK